jgi:ppGpp synthetase/RelA/SpoT-type nucleotidyltranferase
MASNTSINTTTSAAAKKPNLDEYPAWLVCEQNITDWDSLRHHYELIVPTIATTYTDSPFWRAILSGLNDIDAQYLVDHKYPLIADFAPKIVVKPWESFVEKTYRKNIVHNANFPKPPEDGWLTPDNWFTQIHDIVRTTIVVKYLDGVPLMLEFLRSAASTNGFSFHSELEARVNGYYGAHCSCGSECEISDLDWKKIQRRIVFEIQITTSIKDVIKRLLHNYYETRRIEAEEVSIKELSWNYKSDEFIASYLGHILHYVEGMILDVRDRNRG